MRILGNVQDQLDCGEHGAKICREGSTVCVCVCEAGWETDLSTEPLDREWCTIWNESLKAESIRYNETGGDSDELQPGCQASTIVCVVLQATSSKRVSTARAFHGVALTHSVLWLRFLRS